MATQSMQSNAPSPALHAPHDEDNQRNPSVPPGLPRREFFTRVVDRLHQELPEERARFQHRLSTSLLKVYYANERIHFEVWTNGPRGLLEIGLHFEDGPLSTAAYLAFFDSHIIELKHDLGSQLELERWTSSWGHLYEVSPLTKLDRVAADRVARRLAHLIIALQPLIEAAGVPPERSVLPAEPRGPWRAWRRGRG
jgi:hypothetical protein